MSLSELFAQPNDTPEPAVTARRSIGRVDDVVRVTTPNYDYYYLCPRPSKLPSRSVTRVTGDSLKV